MAGSQPNKGYERSIGSDRFLDNSRKTRQKAQQAEERPQSRPD